MSQARAVVEAAIAQARVTWPDVAEPPTLRASLEATTAGDDPHAAIAALCVDDLYLAHACAAGDRTAIAAFDSTYLSRVPAYLARHPAAAQADEVAQQLREKLLVGPSPKIAAYAGKGSLASWVRVAAVRAASNLRRGDRNVDAPDELDALATNEIPELRVLAGNYRAKFRAAFRAAFTNLPAEDRTALRMHFIDGVTVRQLAPILGTSPATAGRRLLAAQQKLGDAVLALLANEVGATPAELESAVRAIVSRLELSLSAMTV